MRRLGPGLSGVAPEHGHIFCFFVQRLMHTPSSQFSGKAYIKPITITVLAVTICKVLDSNASMVSIIWELRLSHGFSVWVKGLAIVIMRVGEEPWSEATNNKLVFTKPIAISG